jgi:hypothetical protein
MILRANGLKSTHTVQNEPIGAAAPAFAGANGRKSTYTVDFLPRVALGCPEEMIR